MKTFLYNLATDRTKGLFFLPIKIVLLLLSFLYGLIIRSMILFCLIDPIRLNCKIISIGNITLGGTGKTSLVELIARILKSKGFRIALLSRGYNRRSLDSLGDEPDMLFNALKDVPVIVGKNRIKNSHRAIKEYGIDTLILDDAMQQWRIKKDIEIITIDSVLPFGNKHMIPRGILREPLSSLKRADVFILTKTNFSSNLDNLKEALIRINPKALVFDSIHMPTSIYFVHKPQELLDIDYIKNKKVALFSGIGDPDSFAKSIINLGADIRLDLRFTDHYNYSQKDLDKIIAVSKENLTDIIITTQKDAARINNLDLKIEAANLMVLCIELKIIKDEERFIDRLLRVYSS